MISGRKIALLHVAKSRLQIPDEAWRSLLHREAACSSSTQLDEAGFDRVMAELARLGFRNVRRPIGLDDRPGMATATQIWRIRSLWKTWTGKDDETHMSRWLRQKMGVSNVRFLNAETGGKCVAVLERIIARRETQAARGGPAKPSPTAKAGTAGRGGAGVSATILAGLNQVLGGGKLSRQERNLFSPRGRHSHLEIIARLDHRQCERVILLALVAIGSIDLERADCEHVSWVIGGALGWRARLGAEGTEPATIELICGLPGPVRERACGVADAVLRQLERMGDGTLGAMRTLRDAIEGHLEAPSNLAQAPFEQRWLTRSVSSIKRALKDVFAR